MNDHQKKLKRNFKLMRFIKGQSLFFVGQVLIAFEINVIGLSLAEMFIGESIFALTIILFEVPSAVFADFMGRKKALIFGGLFSVLGMISLAFATSFAHIILTQILYGICIASMSGADTALVFESLKDLGQEGEYKKIWGKITATSLYLCIPFWVIGAFIADYFSIRMAIYLSIIPALVFFLISFFLEEPVYEKPLKKSQFNHLTKSFKWLFSHKILVFIVLTGVFITLSEKIVFQFFNPLYESLNFPVKYWGLAGGVYVLFAGYCSARAHSIIDKIGHLNSFVVIFLAQIIGFILLAKVSVIYITLLFPLFFEFTYGLGRIFFSDEINKRSASYHRATVSSIYSFIVQFFQVLTLPFLGYIADLYSIFTLFLIMAGVMIITGLFFGFNIHIALKNE